MSHTHIETTKGVGSCRPALTCSFFTRSCSETNTLHRKSYYFQNEVTSFQFHYPREAGAKRLCFSSTLFYQAPGESRAGLWPQEGGSARCHSGVCSRTPISKQTHIHPPTPPTTSPARFASVDIWEQNVSRLAQTLPIQLPRSNLEPCGRESLTACFFLGLRVRLGQLRCFRNLLVFSQAGGWMRVEQQQQPSSAALKERRKQDDHFTKSADLFWTRKESSCI